MAESVSIIIPTLNGGVLFERALAAMRAQTFDGDVEIVVVDSGSRDGTVEAARRWGARVTSIPAAEFHHGRTRNLCLRQASHSLALFTVQDAVPVGADWLATCVGCLRDPSVTAAFGRQIPHADADLYARYAVERQSESFGRRRKVHALARDRDRLRRADFGAAMAAIRLDNVCAIYRRRALEEIPFPEVTIGEDLAWSLRAQRAGHRILYDPDIRVFHSHNRPPEYDFRRSLAGYISMSHIVGKLPIDRGTLGLPEIFELRRALDELEKALLDRPIPRGYDLADMGRMLSRLLGERPYRLVVGAVKGAVAERRRRFSRQGPLRPHESLRREVEEFLWRRYKEARRRYPEADAEGWRRFLSRLCAFEYGKIAAEIYLSREMRRSIPDDLARFVESNVKGV
jgi:GT2 family glycosyltransferase